MWRVERAGAALHIFGGRPATPIPWSAPQAERCLAEATEFWHETPEVTPETQAMALVHGMDASRPLDSFLTPELRSRVASAAAELGVTPALLAPMRPWLAGQILRGAADARRGLDRTTAPESVLRVRAVALGLPVKAEFPTAEDVMGFFGGLPPDAETQWLAVELDEIASDPAVDIARARSWLEGDIAGEVDRALALHRNYPAFYEHLAVARNRAWVPRIQAMLDRGVHAFIVVGIGHMVGPGSLVQQLADAGIAVNRT
jgi:uncharacterized protein YbaP (TraB family)